MLRFLSTRLWNGLLVMIGVSFISFLLFNYIGDPVNNLLGDTVTIAQKDAMRKSLGLDQPMLLRFFKYVGQRKASSASHTATWSRSASCYAHGCRPRWS
jgi:peptide/nickel transport system permease protein